MSTFRSDGSTVTADKIAEWAVSTAAGWRVLFATANVTALDASSFQERVMEDEARVWVVLFTDGLVCAPCRVAKTNLMRLSAHLRGLAVGVGVVDCELPSNRDLCYSRIELPQRPHAPEFRAWPRGDKADLPRGEALFDAADMETHLALQLVARSLRLALAPGFSSPDGSQDEGGPLFSGADPEGEAMPAAPDGSAGGQMRGPTAQWDGPPRARATPLPWGGPSRPDAQQRLR